MQAEFDGINLHHFDNNSKLWDKWLNIYLLVQCYHNGDGTRLRLPIMLIFKNYFASRVWWNQSSSFFPLLCFLVCKFQGSVYCGGICCWPRGQNSYNIYKKYHIYKTYGGRRKVCLFSTSQQQRMVRIKW